jgi:hypothetical protein
MPFYPGIHRISDLLLCKLSGIQVDFQRHFTAGWVEEFTEKARNFRTFTFPTGLCRSPDLTLD